MCWPDVNTITISPMLRTTVDTTLKVFTAENFVG